MGFLENVRKMLLGETIIASPSTPYRIEGEFKAESLPFTRVGVQRLADAPRSDVHGLISTYRRNELVYACINKLAQVMHDPRLIVQRKINGDWETVQGHPLTQLFMYPSPELNQADLLKSWVVSEQSTGIFYAEIIRNGDYLEGMPEFLNPLNPTKITAMLGELEDGGYGVVKYKFKDGSYEEYIPAKNMVVKRIYDPLNKYSGLAPLSVALGTIDADIAQTDYIRAFFNNAGVPSGIIKVKNKTLDQTAAEKIKVQWYMKYGRAYGKQHDIAVLDENADYQKLGSNLNELNAKELREHGESRICMVFDIPPMLVGASVGLSHATYSNMREAQIGLWDNKLTPMFKEYANFIQWRLLPEFESIDAIRAELVRVTWDLSEVAALQEDAHAKIERYSKAWNDGVITLNEYRQALGLSDDDNGEYYVRDSSKIPVQMNTIPPVPQNQASMLPIITQIKNNTKYLPPPDDEDTPEEEIEYKDTPGAEEKRLKINFILALKSKSLSSLELKVQREVEAYLKREYLQAALYIERNWKNDTILAEVKDDTILGDMTFTAQDINNATSGIDATGINWEIESAGFAKLMSKYYPIMLQNGANDAGLLLGDIVFDFNLENPEVQNVLAFLADEVTNVVETTRDEIRALIGKQSSEGWSIPDLADEIRNLGIHASPGRATTIARTETARAYSTGSYIQYTNSGVVDKIEWIVSDPCDLCTPLAGKVVELGVSFTAPKYVGYPPLHPNCKCAILPVLKAHVTDAQRARERVKEAHNAAYRKYNDKLYQATLEKERLEQEYKDEYALGNLIASLHGYSSTQYKENADRFS